MTRRTIALLVLSTNNWNFIKANSSRILTAIDGMGPRSYAEVEIPTE